MKQHKSTSKDNQLLSEMYGQIGGMTIQSTGNADEAAEQLAQDDGFNNAEEAEQQPDDEFFKTLDDVRMVVDTHNYDELVGGMKVKLGRELTKLEKEHVEEATNPHEELPEDGEHHNQPNSEDEAYM
tara:strand:+ start:92 stop:472 length:381 start_codon:yes stop_codon:yes gene_type:complete